MSKKKASKSKTSAAAEKAAREARNAQSAKLPRRSKAAREALDAADALKRNAEAASGPAPADAAALDPADPRAAELLRAKELGLELAENEFIDEPQNLPEGYKKRKVVSRNGKKLPAPVWIVTEPLREAPGARPSATGAKKRTAGRDPNVVSSGWAKGGVESERAQALLVKLKKGTREKPVLAAKQLSDHERHLARKLFARQLIQRDKFEAGIGYFA
jgi:hypothetical protein